MVTSLLKVNGTVRDIAMDWISRTIYMVVRHETGNRSVILAYLMDQGIHREVLSRPGTVSSIAVQPYTR